MFLADINNITTDPLMLGVGYTDKAIISSTEGLIKFIGSGGNPFNLIEGKYLIKYQVKDSRTIIMTDNIGGELLFLYKQANYWCISTSLYQMAEYIKSIGMPLTVKKNDIALNFVQTSLFEQPLNTNPNFEEIRLVSQKQFVLVENQNISIKNKELGWVNTTFKDFTFQQKLSYFIHYYRGIIRELLKHRPIDIELSGGIDSRVLFALFKSNVINQEILVSTDKNRVNDFSIVNMLSENYSFPLVSHDNPNKGRDDYLKKYLLFKYGNIGISRTHKRPNSGGGIKPSSNFRINGGGGGIGKVFYNPNYKAYINLINKSHLKGDVKKQVINNFLLQLAEQEYEQGSAQAMVRLYTKYRLRYFAGRAWYYSLLGTFISPFNSNLFTLIMKSNDLEEFFNQNLENIYQKNLIQLYLLYVLEPKLCFFITDSKEKNFSVEDIILIKKLVDKNEFSSCENIQFKFFGGDSSAYEDELCLEKDFKRSNYENMNNYSEYIYGDISKGFDLLEQADILEENYLLELKQKIKNKALSQQEELSLLHATSMLQLQNA